MARATKRTVSEIEQLITGYEQSGLSRQHYCDQQKIGVPTLDYYRRRYGKPRPAFGQLVKVELQDTRRIEHEAKDFSLVLARGRRIETSWRYNEQDLARLIRIVEAA